MRTERPDDCREWRHLLGAYALGDLGAEERAGLEAHLEGCAECRTEAKSLETVGQLLSLADPERFSRPAPQPAPDLGPRIAATIASERQTRRKRRQRRRFAFAVSGAMVAAAAAVLAIAVLPGGGGDSSPEQHVEFGKLPGGVKIYATLEPHAYGTEIHMYVKGVRSGTRCRVYLRGLQGERVPAGTFTYRWGDDSTATLSSALDLSRTRAIGVHAGNRIFVAPVDPPEAATRANSTEEEAT